MSDNETLLGGCLCSAIRYEIQSVFDCGYCHCTHCKKATGGPVATWVHVEPEHFKLLQGKVSEYPSSIRGFRCFCGTCGSSLYFREKSSRYFTVFAGTLDQPERVAPRVHLFEGEQLSWLKLDDSFPRYPGGKLPPPSRR